MRRVIYTAACSLDGFIAGPRGELDWLHFSADVREELARFWPTVDAILMGRKTFEPAQSGGGGGGDGGGMKTYVFSRTLRQLQHRGAELVTGDAGEFVRRLKEESGKTIYLMGGGDLASSLFEAGVIDEVSMNVHPVLLGSGVPFFRNTARRSELKLEEARPIAGGCVILRYSVRAAATKRTTKPRRAKQA